jgi:hypothetical protein
VMAREATIVFIFKLGLIPHLYILGFRFLVTGTVELSDGQRGHNRLCFQIRFGTSFIHFIYF